MTTVTESNAITLPKRVIKKPEKKEEPVRHVNLCDYALSLAGKKLEYLSRAQDSTHMDEIIKTVNALIKEETGVTYDDVVPRLMSKKLRMDPKAVKLLAGSIRIIARQLEALRIVHSYNIEV